MYAFGIACVVVCGNSSVERGMQGQGRELRLSREPGWRLQVVVASLVNWVMELVAVLLFSIFSIHLHFLFQKLLFDYLFNFSIV